MKNNTVQYINENVERNTDSFILECENRFDEAVKNAVDGFLCDSRRDIVLLAGPSSSGKTTTAKKIAEKIQQLGKNAYTVSLDDFYKNRDEIPVGKDGMQDFECVEALDTELIHSTFASLINERYGELPSFDFNTGERLAETRHIELKKDDVLVVEGLHALNPVITDGLDESHVYRIYISVSTRVTGEDGKVLLNKRNLRLSRRIIRDAKHRNASAEDTLDRWHSVLRGEDKYLFPFESNADIKIDSFHPYEPCIFRDEVIRQLNTVETESENYEKAQELCGMYEMMSGVEASLLPENSLLQEFLG